MIDRRALQLLARFAAPPSTANACGRESAPPILRRCLTTGDCYGVEEELKKFRSLYPFLRTIALLTGQPVFSYAVAEAYWLGNDWLRVAKPKNYGTLLQTFADQGAGPDFLAELKNRPPKKFVPFHLFHVLNDEVGKKERTPEVMIAINRCMVRWGRVLGLADGKAKLGLNSLRNDYHRVIAVESVDYERALLPELKYGDQVAVHWGQVVKVLDQREVQNLEYWTDVVAKSLR